MAWPTPQPGLVIRYAYLWRSEHDQGLEEGAKDRPCAVILVRTDAEGEQIVSVLPITHTPPSHPDDAVEIPLPTKQRLGLDDARSWVMLTEANRFVWPGPDLRPKRVGEPESVAFGYLPQGFFRLIRDRFVAKLEAATAQVVTRTA